MRKRKKKFTQDSIRFANRAWALIKKGKRESMVGTDDYWHVSVVELGKPNGEQYSLYVVDSFKNQPQWQPLIDPIDFETVVVAEGDLSMVRKVIKGSEEVVIDADCRLEFVTTFNKKNYLGEEWKNLGDQNEK
jgi:hypothetical protein